MLLKVRERKEYEAFQLTEENSIDNYTWPNWMNEAWNKDPHQQGFLGRGNMFYHHYDEFTLVIRIADCLCAVQVGDWIIRDQMGYLRSIPNDTFIQKYMEVK